MGGGRKAGSDAEPAGCHGDLVALLRELHHRAGGPTHRAIAGRSGLSAGHISNVLGGRRLPSGDAAAKLALALGARPDEAMRAGRLADAAAEDRPRTRRGGSVYLEQVKRIAPAALKGREDELARLRDFCLGRGDERYEYWQAEAWAGKTALLSWFVLHPPPGVRVVSFFVTSRIAGQKDRTAFIEVLIEQLADLLDRPALPLASEATREPHLLTSLAEAADLCSARGQRLVLVVDGLDEDRSVRHTIAGLLPHTPAADMRVIVSGRPNPRLADDVRDDHPLLDPGTVRVLTVSSHARSIRSEAERDLRSIIDGDRHGRDVLGLLTAAAGALSADDLAALTGRARWQVEEFLNSVAGRVFTRRAATWHPAGADLYLLGHEELQGTATEFLGAHRIWAHRRTIHDWADSYRHRRWPPDTPEYLLRDYFGMLHADLARDRMVTYAVDPFRRDRILDDTGGDAAVLAELTAAQDLVTADSQPDLVLMARLCVQRDIIAERNSHVPVSLPAAWVASDQRRLEDAKRLAGSISNDDRRAQALARIAAATADLDEAEKISRSSTVLRYRAEALAEVAGRAAAAGDLGSAARVAASIADPLWLVTAYCRIARLLPTAHGSARVAALVASAEITARSITAPDQRAEALCHACRGAAALNELASAGRIAGSIAVASRRVDAYCGAARAAARHDRDRAIAFLRRAEDVARTGPEYAWEERPTALLARTWAALGDTDRAFDLARSIRDPLRQVEAVGDIAHDGSPWLDGLTEHATAVASSIREPLSRVRALRTVARLLILRNDEESAAEVGRQAEAVATTVGGPDNRVAALRVAAATWSVCRRVNDAVRVAELIPDPFRRSGALTAAAWVLLDADNPIHAEIPVSRAIAVLPSTGGTHHTRVLMDVARATMDAGHRDRAERLAHAIPIDHYRHQTLADVARHTARGGHLDHARDLASSITDPHQRAEVLCDLAAAAHGDPARATDLVELSVAAAGRIAAPDLRSAAIARAAPVVAEAGQVERARSLAQSVDGCARRAEVLAAIAGVAERAGHHEVAADLLDRAGAAARSVPDPPGRWGAVATVAGVAAGTGRRAHVPLVESISDPYYRTLALVNVARTMGRVGRRVEALAVVARAEATVDAIANQTQALAALATVSRVAATLDAPDLAHRIATRIDDRFWTDDASADIASAFARAGQVDRAESVARSITAPRQQDDALIEVAVTAAATGHVKDAELIALSVPDPGRRAHALGRVAVILFDNGDDGRARHLVAQVMQDGHWRECVTAIAAIDPAAVAAVADDLLWTQNAS